MRGSRWSVASTVRNGSPRSASRRGTSAIVTPSGRRSGSSSSSQSIGADTGACGGGPGAVRRDERLVDRVLGVVEPGVAAALAHVQPQLTSSGTTPPTARDSCCTQARVSSNDGPAGDRDPDLDAAPAGELGLGAHAQVLQRGAVQPGQGEDVLERGRRARGPGRSARTSAGAARRSSRSRRATPAPRSSPPRPARPARPRRGRWWCRPPRRPGCPSAPPSPGHGRAAASARSLWCRRRPGSGACSSPGRPGTAARSVRRGPRTGPGPAW